MCLFRIQVWITVADGSRVADIAERIQVPDTRTVDTEVVVGSQGHGRTEHVGEIGRWYDVVEICVEVPVGHIGIFHIHDGMFVAYTGLETEFFPFQLIVGVSGQDVLSLVELTVQVFGRLHGAVVVFPVILAVAGIQPVDVFQSGIHIMHVVDGVYVVHLCGMFRGMCIVVIILFAELSVKVCWIIVNILVGGCSLATVG